MSRPAAEVANLASYLTADEQSELQKLLSHSARWTPLPGPQLEAYVSEADVLGLGGAAGGGKSDFIAGLALNEHERSIIFRREGTELVALIERIIELVGDRKGYNGQERIMRLPERQIEFGSAPAIGEERKYQGRPHDLICFDEATNFAESQVRFLMGWLRSTNPDQRKRVVMTFNPPTDAEGRWVISFFAPWLDDGHPNPAEPGELRYFAMVNGTETEMPDGEPFIDDNGELVRPQSRTFIPSRVTDNPYLMETNYYAQLQALPEPLRSMMLYGDFKAGIEDDPWQVIPTRWVDEAIERWRNERPDTMPGMDAMGVDVARGGKDETVLVGLRGRFVEEPVGVAGSRTASGGDVAALVISRRRDHCIVRVDAIGVGSAVVDALRDNDIPTDPVVVSSSPTGATKDGRLGFANRRSELWWRLREALDPDNPDKIALPPNKKLRADIVLPRWKIKARRIIVESTENMMKRHGRSPDYASALCLALIGPGERGRVQGNLGEARRRYNPLRGRIR